MNKAVNTLSGIFFLLYGFLVMALGFDLSLSSGLSLTNMPWQKEIAYGFTLVIFLLGMLRIIRRWQGIKDMKKFDSFRYAQPISYRILGLSSLFTMAETVFMVGAIIFLSFLVGYEPTLVYPMIAVLFILALESASFALRITRKGKAFRIGISDTAVAYFDREMHILYFTSLIRVEMHQDMINFQYKDDLNLFLPLDVIRKEDLAEFRRTLMDSLTEYGLKKSKTIYFDDAFRNLE
jgi:hypothetical protein